MLLDIAREKYGHGFRVLKQHKTVKLFKLDPHG
jgi:hypothetical protein